MGKIVEKVEKVRGKRSHTTIEITTRKREGD